MGVKKQYFLANCETRLKFCEYSPWYKDTISARRQLSNSLFPIVSYCSIVLLFYNNGTIESTLPIDIWARNLVGRIISMIKNRIFSIYFCHSHFTCFYHGNYPSHQISCPYVNGKCTFYCSIVIKQ